MLIYKQLTAREPFITVVLSTWGPCRSTSVPQRWSRRIAPLDTDHQTHPVFGAEKERTRSPDRVRLPPLSDACLARRTENGSQIRFPLERRHFNGFTDFISHHEPGGICGWRERIKGRAATSIHAAHGSARRAVLSKCFSDGLYARCVVSRRILFLHSTFRSRGWSFGPARGFCAARRRESSRTARAGA
jgi:hypothetical protein